MIPCQSDHAASTAADSEDDDLGSHSIIASYLIIYGKPCVWIIGTFGNLLVLLTFSRREMRNSLTGFLFQWLAVFDLFVVQEHVQSFFVLAGVDLFALSAWTCSLVYWLITAGKFVAVWIIIAIGAERLVGIVWPHKSKQLCLTRHGKLFLFVASILSLAVCSPYLLASSPYGYSEPALGRVVYYCINLSDDRLLMHYMRNVRPWVELLIYSLLPWILLLSINSFIIARLVRMRDTRRNIWASTGASGGSAVSHLTRMLLLVSFSFLLLSLPTCVHSIMEQAHEIYIDQLWAVGVILQGLNHSVNFFLYCFSGGTFRRELGHVLSCTDRK